MTRELHEEKKLIFEQAKEKTVEKNKLIRVTPKSSQSQRNNAAGFLNRFKLNQLNSEDQRRIKSEARFMAIESYFGSIDKLII